MAFIYNLRRIMVSPYLMPGIKMLFRMAQNNSSEKLSKVSLKIQGLCYRNGVSSNRMDTPRVDTVTIDARILAPSDRHRRIFEQFIGLKTGQELYVIIDHDPRHLVEHMKQEGLPLDASPYRSFMNDDGTFVGVFRRMDDVPVEGKVKVTSIDEERSYLPDRFSPVAIYAEENYKVLITYIKARQFIPVHSPSTDLVFAVFRGTGSAYAGSREVPLLPGSIIVVPRGEKRGIKAQTDIEAFHVVSPIPGENDHREVKEKILANRYL